MRYVIVQFIPLLDALLFFYCYYILYMTHIQLVNRSLKLKDARRLLYSFMGNDRCLQPTIRAFACRTEVQKLLGGALKFNGSYVSSP